MRSQKYTKQVLIFWGVTMIVLMASSSIFAQGAHIVLTPSMFFKENGTPATAANEAGYLGNQQSNIGNPFVAGGGTVFSNFSNDEWYLPWGNNVKAYIDLGQEYNITKFNLFDGSGQGTFTVAAGLPSQNNAPFLTISTSLYGSWHSPYTTNVTTRYLTINKTTDDAKVVEIAIFGTPVGGGGGGGGGGTTCAFTITAPTFNIDCYDNFTPGLTTDDVYTFDFKATRSDNANGAWNALVDGFPINANYGDTVTLGPFAISAGTLNFQVKDAVDNICVKSVSFIPGSQCTVINSTQEGGTGGGGSTNIALNKTTVASPVKSDATFAIPANAVDGNTNGETYAQPYTTYHSQYLEQPFWMVDLGSSQAVDTFEIWNTTDGNRLSDYYVFYSNAPISQTATTAQLETTPGVSFVRNTLDAGRPTKHALGTTARYIMIKKNGWGFVTFSEGRAMQSSADTNYYSVTNVLLPSPAGSPAVVKGARLKFTFDGLDKNIGVLSYSVYNQNYQKIQTGKLSSSVSLLNFQSIRLKDPVLNSIYLLEIENTQRDQFYYLKYQKK